MSSAVSATLKRVPVGESATGAQRATDPELYVIATHKVRDRSGRPPYRWVPYGLEHAWPPGARRTLCGEWTSGWTVFWERRFSAAPSSACHACIEASLPAASRSRLDPVGAQGA